MDGAAVALGGTFGTASTGPLRSGPGVHATNPSIRTNGNAKSVEVAKKFTDRDTKPLFKICK
jgi:hypothetical protein